MKSGDYATAAAFKFSLAEFPLGMRSKPQYEEKETRKRNVQMVRN